MKISNRKKVLGIFFSTAVFVLILSVLTPALGVKPNTITTNITNGYGYGYCCDPHTPGFWRNHPEAWPVSSIIIGGVTYPMADAIALIFHPSSGGDKTYNMFEHLVAAKLNVLSCDEPPSGIADVISDADDWMSAHHVGTEVKANSPAWQIDGAPVFNQLVSYNES